MFGAKKSENSFLQESVREGVKAMDKNADFPGIPKGFSDLPRFHLASKGKAPYLTFRRDADNKFLVKVVLEHHTYRSPTPKELEKFEKFVKGLKKNYSVQRFSSFLEGINFTKQVIAIKIKPVLRARDLRNNRIKRNSIKRPR